MNIGIIEIMPFGHFTLVECVAKVYCSDPNNSVKIFINSNTESKIVELVISSSNIELVLRKEEEELHKYFSRINEFKLDILYITTMGKYYNEFYEFIFSAQINLFIHNIDEWFNLSFIKRISSFFYGFTLSKKLIYDFKVNFIYPIQRDKIIDKVKRNGGKFVVLSSILKKELSLYIKNDLIEIIPFSFYDKKLTDKSQLNTRLRICIPGTLSNNRRDYLGILDLFDINSELFSTKIELDLLGYPLQKEDNKIIQKAKLLVIKGIKVHLYEHSFIPTGIFNENLSKADIILGNLKIQQGKFSFYGKTKETGVTFALIRAAKPGIIVEGYDIMDELKSSVLYYKDMDQLKEILLRLVDDKVYLDILKKEAQKNSQSFEPFLIYKNLRQI
jgi:hypothetical protein